MGTGRMPNAPDRTSQAPGSDKVKFSEEQIAAIAAYVASLAPGPAGPRR
jgi:ubiquinol-cytochrome c reductase cytochrome c subunit